MSATVDITDVFEHAVKVKAEEVTPGDFVFDAMGGTHTVKSVVRFVHTVRITRVDRVVSNHEMGSTITIVRGNGPVKPQMRYATPDDAGCEGCGSELALGEKRSKAAWYVVDGDEFCSISCVEETLGVEVDL